MEKILYGVILAADYLHTKSILHNDIKENNIVIVQTSVDVSSVLIDLGKGCFIKNAKLCSITSEKKQQDHISKYPHLAPDLIRRHCKQSEKSDMYSVGRIIKIVNKQHIDLPVLESMGSQCTEYYCNNRPSAADMRTFLHNLIY